MPLNIVRQDITKMNTDAIVAAEGRDMTRHGWMGTAIAEAAGKEYQKACEELGYCGTGDVIMTRGYNLPAKYVIHAVGPKYVDGNSGESIILKACYEKSLRLAKKIGCNSIALPLISTGGYRFPKEQGLRIAIDTINDFLKNDEMDIYLVTYDRLSTLLSRDLDYDVKEYIDDNYVGEENVDLNRYLTKPPGGYRTRAYERLHSKNKSEEYSLHRTRIEPPSAEGDQTNKVTNNIPTNLKSALKIRDESFQQMLFRLIVEKDLKNSEVYLKANMSKSHFSKIKSNPDYKPKKETVFALAVALELDINETRELMMKAGYAISHSFVLDTIVEYFIIKKKYNIMDINIVLFDNDQPLLGEKPL